MKKILFILMAAIVCCSVISCNEKPKQYKFVKVMNDGKEQVEELDAKNDTDALKQYIIRMEKILTTSIAKGEEPDFKVMFIVSPEGDTLNTNKDLLEAVASGLPQMIELPAGEAPATADAPKD